MSEQKTTIKKTNYRWAIVAMLFFATTVNYFDRFLMGILAPLLDTEIGWKYYHSFAGSKDETIN